MDQTPPNDQTLIDRLRAGEESAADEVIARFATPLVCYFQMNARCEGQAEDLAQETLLRLLRGVRSEKHEPIQNLPAYLFRIARNLAADLRKHQATRPVIESLTANDQAGDVPSSAADPREAAIHEEQRRLVRGALLQLDESTREVLTLRHIDGMTCPDIARLLGIAEGTVWSRLHRGLRELREKLNCGNEKEDATASEGKIR